MFLKTLSIEGYKNFRAPFEIEFIKGLNIIVGENGTGKSAVVDAIRLLLLEDEYGRSSVSEGTFHTPFNNPNDKVDHFRVHGRFSALSPKEDIAFHPWMEDTQATLTLHVQNKLTARGRFKWDRWGGVSRSSIFENELFESIHCVYLPPLRDAEAKLREGRGSRLARLLLNLNRKELLNYQKRNELHPLEKKIQEFNKKLSDEDETIRNANRLIQDRLQDALGSIFGQDTRIQYSESNFNRIIENLRLLFYPEFKTSTSARPELFRSLDQNTLGHNNLLYLATVLAELNEESSDPKYLRLLLIEEPEAHLHPQLQIRLLKYLEEKSREEGMQIIVTTHSPVVASAVSLNSLIHLSGTPSVLNSAVSLKNCGLSVESASFISRWLDATKSTLLFARGIILVEGISEAMLLPELAKRVLVDHNNGLAQEDSLPTSLEEAGVSVINMGGIYFKHFLRLFCSLDGETDDSKIHVRCAGITDKDPDVTSDYWRADNVQGNNPALKLGPLVNKSKSTRLYWGKFRTLEFDLAMAGNNAKEMLEVLAQLWPSEGTVKSGLIKRSKFAKAEQKDINKRRIASEILKRVANKRIGKAYFAQELAVRLSKTTQPFGVPEYIRRAVIWSCGGEPDNPSAKG